ncbi:glutathione-dependent formaldehyde-activating protein [Caballeronia terrestris]|uniref:Glutathione-dependent formaldehyde-activating protein n=1 Tax=Caballeronia terrestris TaxID=1226301 RepID=A0A158JME4_9BURK|nr:glutathione-dependent formaldehyde-activating protein [Caballeronia terrestris]
MIDASCHCGAVRFAIDAAPTEVNDCGCSICRRYGTLWAYYEPSEVRFAAGSGPTDVYMWSERRLEFHRCRTCGCVTHWRARDPNWTRMGVNARMMPPEVAASAAMLRNGLPIR